MQGNPNFDYSKFAEPEMFREEIYGNREHIAAQNNDVHLLFVENGNVCSFNEMNR